VEQFGYTSVMQAPKVQKITVNMGVGEAKQDSKMLDAAAGQLAQIAGQAPNVRLARKSIANFKLREGMPVGLAVTLRGDRAYEFLDRLMSVAIPRIRDFRGLPANFDGRGNYTIGVREQIIFPEIDYDAVDQIRGLDIAITTSAATDEEGHALLSLFGMPFIDKPNPEQIAAEEAAKAAEDAAKREAAELAKAELSESESAGDGEEAEEGEDAAAEPSADATEETSDEPEDEAANDAAEETDQ
ncbi:MAG: 50S ribosomal protein L5, partial [Actinobacteria bacterium]|nr:50S ribosomal protein L5 [Actinomycetota bacterium]